VSSPRQGWSFALLFSLQGRRLLHADDADAVLAASPAEARPASKRPNRVSAEAAISAAPHALPSACMMNEFKACDQRI